MKVKCLVFGHSFGEWTYIAPNSCKQVRVCKRCGHKEQREVPHDFGEWTYITSNSCEQVRICKKCEYQEQQKHAWGEWEDDRETKGGYTRYCKRCEAYDYKDDEEIYQKQMWDNWT